MSLAKKLFIPAGIQVPAIRLAPDVELDDIHPWSVDFAKAKNLVLEGKSPSIFVFVENLVELGLIAEELNELWEQQLGFWIFFPKKPHLETDLAEEVVRGALKSLGATSAPAVEVDANWSCMYFKNGTK